MKSMYSLEELEKCLGPIACKLLGLESDLMAGPNIISNSSKINIIDNFKKTAVVNYNTIVNQSNK